ncbi:hypothetical protein EDEG_03416 [Edhazardia aedis USNM 41457]|uniref:Uncharacterized protein n=1 Tax=Edhazardia aedis (strain USNM 41457) TaxID=1003232 RepID=J8ZR37_EDHAE|nr:hypothetical protein EDEG_03416 [Edhazardia aedis USNM 41457]|eukprot:EJW02148.1 hypothetical protein EDEG_03416 [Edhazardia aedis USNM 41457]
MRQILSEKTNTTEKQIKKGQAKSDKETVLTFLNEIKASTKDYSLAYDLSKCIEIVCGKENEEVVDLKSALEDVLIENEMLIEQRNQLIAENDYLKGQFDCYAVEDDKNNDIHK